MLRDVYDIEEAAVVGNILESSNIKVKATTFQELLLECENLKKKIDKVVNALEPKVKELESKVDALKMERSGDSYSWVKKNITKRAQYKKEMLDLEQNLKSAEKELEKLSDEYFEAKRGQRKVAMLSEQTTNFQEEFLRKKTLNDFGLDYNKAKAMLEQAGKPVVITRDDLPSISSRSATKIDSLDKLVGVHITNYLPEGEIKTANAATAKNPKKDAQSITIDGKKYPLPFISPRKTIHFAMNGPVTGGFVGSSNWENMKYAVLCPFKDIQNSVVEAAPMDTYIRGNHKLTPNTTIMCPKGEREIVQKKNPNVTIIEYEGESVHEFVPFVVSNVMGYKPEKIGMWNWGNEKDDAQYRDLMQKNGFSMQAHSNTKQASSEKLMKRILDCVEIVKLVNEKGLIKNKDDLNRICDQISEVFNFQNLDGANVKEKDLPMILAHLHHRLKNAGLPSMNPSELEQFYTYDKKHKHNVIDANTNCELYSLSGDGVFKFRHGVTDRSVNLDNIEIHGVYVSKGTNGLNRTVVVNDKEFTEKELGRLLEYDEADDCCRIKVDRKSENVAKIVFKTCFPNTFLSKQKHNAIAGKVVDSENVMY